MSPELSLISHPLCPYVQRALVSLAEKGVPFERIDVDLAAKPDWFRALSPLGKTPVLRVDGQAVFESAVILEYLEETQPRPLHPADALARAEHRSWIEFGSTILADIAALYGAPDAASFANRAQVLAAKFGRLEARLDPRGPYFDGREFRLVDAVYGPVFRYFDVFDEIGDFGVLSDKPRCDAWRAALRDRPSVRNAVGADYEARLRAFLGARGSYLSSLMSGQQ